MVPPKIYHYISRKIQKIKPLISIFPNDCPINSVFSFGTGFFFPGELLVIATLFSTLAKICFFFSSGEIAFFLAAAITAAARILARFFALPDSFDWAKCENMLFGAVPDNIKPPPPCEFPDFFSWARAASNFRCFKTSRFFNYRMINLSKTTLTE